MIRIVDRYLGQAILASTFFSLLTLLSISGLFRFVEQLKWVGQGYYDLFHATLYTLYTIPNETVVFFPMAVLIGGLVGLGGLASSSELVVMQAAGMSRFNIIGALMKTALVMIIAVMALAEWGAPAAEQSGRELRAQALSGGDVLSAKQGVWAKDGNSFVNIRSVSDNGVLNYVSIYQFNPDLTLASIRVAKQAKYQDSAWQLTDITDTVIHRDHIERQQIEEADWHSSLSPSKLGVASVKPEALSIAGLSDYIGYLQSNQQDASRFQLALWRKLLQPVSVTTMLLLALSFIFGPLRSVSMGARILMGVVTGFGFHMSNEIFGPISLVYELPPLVGAMLPSLCFLVAATILLNRKG